MERILSIGLDHDLMSTREAVLAQTGAAVQSTQPELATRMLKAEAFDLVVLCHTVPPRDVELIYQVVEESCPSCRILSLAPIAEPHDNGRCLHVEFDWHSGPGALVKLARNLMQPLVADGPIRSTRLGLHLVGQRAVRA